jgi:hypothetical protein
VKRNLVLLQTLKKQNKKETEIKYKISQNPQPKQKDLGLRTFGAGAALLILEMMDSSWRTWNPSTCRASILKWRQLYMHGPSCMSQL